MVSIVLRTNLEFTEVISLIIRAYGPRLIPVGERETFRNPQIYGSRIYRLVTLYHYLKFGNFVVADGQRLDIDSVDGANGDR